MATACLLAGAALLLAGSGRRRAVGRRVALRRRWLSAASDARRPAGALTSPASDVPRRRRFVVVAALSAGVLPWVVLTGPAAAVGSVVAALVAGLVARRVTARGPTPSSTEHHSVPLTLDLLAAALRAGATPVAALRAVGRSAPPPHDRLLQQIAALLALGAAPTEAWAAAESDPHWRLVARTAIRSGDSGLRLADSWEKLAGDLRAELRAGAAARAERVGVLGLLPLAACFLPAFVCLGVVPVIAGLAVSVLHR